MTSKTSNRGFASMSRAKRRHIASMGGSASSGNFKNDPVRAKIAGKQGAEAQPIEAKRLGGRRSHSK